MCGSISERNRGIRNPKRPGDRPIDIVRKVVQGMEASDAEVVFVAHHAKRWP